MDCVTSNEIKISKIYKTITHIFPFSITIISSHISDIFNFIKIKGLYFEVKPYIFQNSYLLNLKKSNDSITLKYEVIIDTTFSRKVKFDIIAMNNIKCDVKFTLFLSYYENTCEYSTLVSIENKININGYLNEKGKKEIDIFKKFYYEINFEDYLNNIESIILKNTTDTKLKISCIINKNMIDIYNYVKNFNNILNCLKIFQKYEKNIIGESGAIGNTLYLTSNKNRFEYKINFIEKDDEHIILNYDKKIEQKEQNHKLSMKIYSISENKCIFFAETGLSSSFSKKQIDDFLNFMKFYAQNIKDSLER